MRKIHHKYENPIDNYFIELSDIASPYAYSLGLTPNMITTLSNVACIITILLLLNANYYWAALFFMLSYYFDCLDGYMARKYNMMTSFGDYYDHISDFIKIFTILATLYYINPQKFYKVIPIILLVCITSIIHLGCQELLYINNESHSLELTKNFCPVKNQNDIEQIKKTIDITKLFGCGTFNITLVLSIIYYDF